MAGGERPGGIEAAISALNAVVGDHLQKRHNGLAIEAGFYQGNHRVALDTASLAAAYPASTGRLAIWVHGLGHTEAVWGSCPSELTSYTPLLLRYNSGLHVSENGELLARLINELVAAFPVPVRELLLVGHSMGGLVIRSACHTAAEEELDWLPLVRRAIYLGVPHLGAPLERVGHVVAWTLRNVPSATTRLLADVLDVRSSGVRDLGRGRIARADWEAADPRQLLQSPHHPVPLLPSIEHFLVVGALEGPLVSALFGDGMVPVASASGPDPLIPASRVRVMRGVGHRALAHHPRVMEQLRSWCEEASP